MKGSRFLESVNDPGQNWLAYFLVGVLGLGILGNGVANLILEDLAGWIAQSINWPKVIIQVGILCVIAAVIFYGIRRAQKDEQLQQLLSGRVQSQTNVVPLNRTYCGLIAIASKPISGKTTTAEEAFHFHWQQGNGDLRYYWIICTEKIFEENARRFREIARNSTQSKTPVVLLENESDALRKRQDVGRVVQIQILRINWPTAQDPNAVKQIVDQIYDKAKALSLDESSVIADYTGGLKSTSAGVILSCSIPQRRLQYTSGVYDPLGNLQGSEMMEVKLSYQLKLAKD